MNLKVKRSLIALTLSVTVMLPVTVFARHAKTPSSHTTDNDYSGWLWKYKTTTATTEWPDAHHYTRVQHKDPDNNYKIISDSGAQWGWDRTSTSATADRKYTAYSYWGHNCSISK